MTSRHQRFLGALGCVMFALAVACQKPTLPAALEDTPDNRHAQAERYLQIMPPEDLMRDMAEKMAAQMPEDKRARFVDLMTKRVDQAKLRSIMLEAMAKHFTAAELRALGDFYESPLGKSAMRKFGAYMADAMPAIQAEFMAAFGKVQSEI